MTIDNVLRLSGDSRGLHVAFVANLEHDTRVLRYGYTEVAQGDFVSQRYRSKLRCYGQRDSEQYRDKQSFDVHEVCPFP